MVGLYFQRFIYSRNGLYTIERRNRPNYSEIENLSMSMQWGVMRAVSIVLFGSTLAELQSDSGLQRDGRILKVGLPNPMGSNPYSISKSPYSVVHENLNPDQGEIYTDDTSNGYRIRKALLDMHNFVRKLEAPSATYMTKLIWDFHLEAYSRQWAEDLCLNPTSRFFEHSPNSQDGLPRWPTRIATGENLYTTTAVRESTEDFGQS